MFVKQSNNQESSLTSDAPLTETTKSGITGLKPIELAYIGGYFDGEGCITHGGGKGRQRLEIHINNTYPRTLERIQEIFGGTLKERWDGNPNHRGYFSFRLNGDNASNFLEAMLPYLREKRAQAYLGLELRKTPPGQARDVIAQHMGSLKRINYGT